MELQLFQVDSFTTSPFSGNPAGVVVNADGLSDVQMQVIAREMNNSETAFLINTASNDYDIQVRFFTPKQEVPICGHATVAAHYVYAREQGIEKGVVRQKTMAGILPVEIVQEDNDLRIVMTQAAIKYGHKLGQSQITTLVEALGINQDDLDLSLPVQIVSTGHSKVMVPIKRKKVLDSVRVNASLLSALSEKIGCNGFYTFTFDSQEEGVLVAGRMFAPAIGIAEDPVTGNANGPLGAYLTKYNRLEKRENGTVFTIKQGEAMQRKGYMDVHVYSSGEEATLVKISGRACIVFQTVIHI